MSSRLVYAVLDGDIHDDAGKGNHVAKYILLALAFLADEDSTHAWLSRQWLVEHDGISLRRSARWLAWLQQWGYIMPTGRVRDGGAEVEYAFNVVKLAAVWRMDSDGDAV